MLSPGNYHRQVPIDVRENLAFRVWLLERARDDRLFQRGLVEMCRRDILFFIKAFVWQYNPQHVGAEVGPFITWEFQDNAAESILAAIEKGGRTDLIIEKSREMGASWLCLIVMLWLFLFHPWKKFLCISRSEEAVDKPEEPDCLFWKLDFIIEHLPDWMARTQVGKVGAGNIKRRKRGFRQLENGSSITGQASTGKAGVGGRATAMFIDEFSQIDEGYEVLHRTADTTGCRIFNFTHTGLDTAAYEMSQRVDVRKLVMHWSMHPEKNRGLYRFDMETNRIEPLDPSYEYPADYVFVRDGTPGGPFAGLRSPWYDAEEKRRQSKRAVAMDLDIDPRGATSQFFDAGIIKNLQRVYCRDPYWTGDLAYDKDTGNPVVLVPRRDGPLRLWTNVDPEGRIPEALYAAGADLSTGSGATPSCISVVNVKTGEKVAEFASAFIDPISLAPLAVALCRLFADDRGEGAAFAWEMQGPGITFGKKVIELGYRNVYYRTAEHTLLQKVSDAPGWVPTPNNQLVVLGEYRAALAKHQFINRSYDALDECLSFVYDGSGKVVHGSSTNTNDPTGARENHGDRVIADALAWKMAKGGWAAQKEERITEARPGSIAWRRQAMAEQSEWAY